MKNYNCHESQIGPCRPILAAKRALGTLKKRGSPVWLYWFNQHNPLDFVRFKEWWYACKPQKLQKRIYHQYITVPKKLLIDRLSYVHKFTLDKSYCITHFESQSTAGTIGAWWLLYIHFSVVHLFIYIIYIFIWGSAII